MARVMIVDDEVENLSALKRALGDENPDWEILSAENEEQCLSMLEEQLRVGEPIDVVLTDLVMATESSGMNVLQKARRIDPLIMAILFTAKEKSLDRYAAFDHGAFDVVEKNIRGTAASREINIKTRAALRYREWSAQINFLRRYFDPRVFKTIEDDPSLLAIRRRTLTIVFWDIRGFSCLCEILKAHPELIVGFLTDYCEAAARAIFAEGGVLDKYIGDGVMALFGVLNQKDDAGKSDALAAIESATAFRKRFDAIRAKWMDQWELYVPDRIEIGLGCGVHTGEVLAGNVGTEFRDQFTALGPHVNFASRIESRCPPGEILISQSTLRRVESTLSNLEHFEDFDDVKNIPGKYRLFRVVHTDDQSDSESDQRDQEIGEVPK